MFGVRGYITDAKKLMRLLSSRVSGLNYLPVAEIIEIECYANIPFSIYGEGNALIDPLFLPWRRAKFVLTSNPINAHRSRVMYPVGSERIRFKQISLP